MKIDWLTVGFLVLLVIVCVFGAFHFSNMEKEVETKCHEQGYDYFKGWETGCANYTAAQRAAGFKDSK